MDKVQNFYQGPERRRKVFHYAKQLKAQNIDSRRLLEDVRDFNTENNDPPLPDSDIKHLISTLENLQNMGHSPTGATSLTTSDGSQVSRYAVRTITLSGGRKIKMRGAEIIGVD